MIHSATFDRRAMLGGLILAGAAALPRVAAQSQPVTGPAPRVNEEGALATADHPGRFGLFASLTLPDVDGALAEAEHAFDVLKADGVTLESNHHGIYMGDSRFDPLFAELDRRRAVVFMHPTSPTCPCCQAAGLAYPRPMLEFMFETTRAV